MFCARTPRIRPKMENFNDIEDVTVVDVYDIASDIGKECEKIIDLHGADSITSLMPKVINALELLETLATRNERENTELQELQSRIAQLETDKLEKSEYRQKFDKDLEAIEDQWRMETNELVTHVSRLEDEIRRLLKEQSPNHRNAFPTNSEVTDCDMLQRLKDSLEKHRDEIRLKDKELQEKGIDVENLKSQIERTGNITKDLRRKHKSLQNQVRTLCDERADFLVQLQDQQRNITSLRQRLGLAQKENDDLVKHDQAISINSANDPDDPHRPRFSAQELKDLLNERNELKTRVNDLEDELKLYKPATKTDPIEEDDPPVQGPLPYEPDDAPWKKSSETGIRKFFRKLFSESNNGGSFPRRSLSTLSKMALSSTSEPVPV